MSVQLPGNLAEIFPMRFRIRGSMSFRRSGDSIIAERDHDGECYTIRPWQHAMLTRMDGGLTFEEIARECYAEFGGRFTAKGLLNFYNWLYDEDIVFLECASIFELIEEEETASPPALPAHHLPNVTMDRHDDLIETDKEGGENPFQSFLPDGWKRDALRVAAIVLFCLAVGRLAFVTAPIAQVPVKMAYASLKRPMPVAPESKQLVAQETMLQSPVAELEFAGQARIEDIPSPPAIGSTPKSESRIDQLRRSLAECRIRRDEFYLQNDEEGYRTEVAKLAEIAREIGEIE